MQTGRYFAIWVLSVLCCQGATPSASVILPMTETQKQGALFIDALSVPSPGEVFVAMNKACRPNWVTLVTSISAPVTTERSQLALAVGVLAANGYIAVEAQDGQQVKNVGREMMQVAKALGISESLMGRGNSLIQFADNNDWEALAEELEATENEVKATMVGQKDKELVSLTSAAAWLRGVEVATAVVLGSPTLQGASVIEQPALARRLSLQLGDLPGRVRQGDRVVMVRDYLDQIAAILERVGAGKDPSMEKKRKEIQKIHELSASAVVSIMASANASPTPMMHSIPIQASEGISNIMAVPTNTSASSSPSKP